MPTRPGLSVPPAHSRKGLVLSPVRTAQLRVLAPMLTRFLQAHDELAGRQDELARRLDEVSAQLAEANTRLDRLTEETAAANALVWDQVALGRRLAEIEDRLEARSPADDG